MLNLHKWLDEQPSGDTVAMESLRALADDLAPYLEIAVRVQDVEDVQRLITAAKRVWVGSLPQDGSRVHIVGNDALEELRIALVSGGWI